MNIDNRLLKPDGEVNIIEDFNRTLSIIDLLSEVVADIKDSQLFKVVFNSNGGSAVSTQYIIEGEKATEPSNPTKTGYTFDTWLNGEEEYDFDDEVVENLILDATYNANEYTISYTLDGGTVSEENPTSYTIESEDITLNNPTKEGYRFDGWTGTGLEEASTEVVIASGSYGNRTYTATWTEVVPEEPVTPETPENQEGE